MPRRYIFFDSQTFRVSHLVGANMVPVMGRWQRVAVSCIAGGSQNLTVSELKVKKAVSLRIYQTSGNTVHVLMASPRNRSHVIMYRVRREKVTVFRRRHMWNTSRHVTSRHSVYQVCHEEIQRLWTAGCKYRKSPSDDRLCLPILVRKSLLETRNSFFHRHNVIKWRLGKKGLLWEDEDEEAEVQASYSASAVEVHGAFHHGTLSPRHRPRVWPFQHTTSYRISRLLSKFNTKTVHIPV